LFTLTVTATQSAAYNVEVTDLPAVGFTYRAGSWTATSSERGDLKGLGITTEPTYASPGIWQLGDMIEDEVVTLTYIADISNDQKPGLYKDLAWAFGCRIETDCVVGDENATLSMAVNPGFVDDNYVGTQVNVVKEQQPGGSIQGEVLGASTELPATGANSAWLALAAILFLFGIGLIAAGRFTRRYYA
jgi:LPXTG-motif cell wall-anchored protein